MHSPSRQRSTHQSDHANALVSPVPNAFLPCVPAVGRLPLRAVYDGPLERVQTLDIRPRPTTEQAEARKEDVRAVLKLHRLFILRLLSVDALLIGLNADGQDPLALVVVPLRANQPVAELDERPELPVVDDALDVGTDFGAGDVELGPAVDPSSE